MAAAAANLGPYPGSMRSRRLWSPAANAAGAAKNVSIMATFSQAMTAASATSFVVHGAMTGTRTGTYGGAGTTSLTFDPDADFAPGERVQVVFTAGSTTGLPSGAVRHHDEPR